ncbi:hypothetical protein DID88_002805 [Monilinia fructigena]|uniref:Carbohydrate kinase FGGY C-terminal domain-containing protein n=1 Tax=Monilinia fructigena TaxID=38457 RepID=A0A395IN51_9HELO|nr:hypothetical protein DID88_002805 [Monilinia fructigena]
MGGVDGNGHYLSAGELVGTLSEKAGNELGLPAGIAVGSGVIDAYAAGSVLWNLHLPLAMSRKPVFVDGVWGPYRDVLLPGYWMAEGGQSATGELLKHVLETHPAYNEAMSMAESFNTSIYDYLNSHLEELMEKENAPTISYLGRHFFFYGDLWGNRSPIANPKMTGSVIGLTNDRSMDGLAIYYYATMGIHRHANSSNCRDHERGRPLHHLHFHVRLTMPEQNPHGTYGDHLCYAVLIPRYVHAAVVHGAAMLGAKAASADKEGKTEELWSIMDRMSKPGKITRPGKNANEKKLLDVKYKVFLEQCKTQQVYRDQVDEAIEGWSDE